MYYSNARKTAKNFAVFLEAGKEVRTGAKAGAKTARREIVVEPDMKASYVLIDSNGCLLDNAVDEMTPVEVCDCLREDFADGLKKLTLDRKRYEARYSDSLS